MINFLGMLSCWLKGGHSFVIKLYRTEAGIEVPATHLECLECGVKAPGWN